MIKKLRLIIENFTEQTIKAVGSNLPSDDDNHKCVVVDYSAPRFAYLRKILRKGMTINVLDSKQLIQNATLFPQHIIVEPDFLIDISSLASCFKEYGHHALNFTVSRLSKTEATQPILLGYYAGSALDEIVNNDTFNFASVLTRCFQQQPLEYVTCREFNAGLFKTAAMEQARNISEIVNALRSDYDISKTVLEPSFVCEALGLQGRVDMMTTDFRLLVEQKSGKNFNLANSLSSDIGYHKEDHYAQLLLYFSVLYYNFDVKREDIDIYLLYSKYAMPTGLLPVEYHDAIISEALMLRNQIVATDLLVAERGFQSIRHYLRPDVVNVRKSQGKLWRRFQGPELEKRLGLYSNILASPLLYKYFDTMATFVYREQRSAWLGESNEQSTAVSYLWKMSLKEKQETGNIFFNLQLKDVKDNVFLSLSVNNEDEDFLPNFRRGDSVYLYEYENVPDVRKAFLHKANIINMTSDELVLKLMNPVRSLTETVLSSDNICRYAIEHSATNSSTTSSLRSLSAFLQADPERQALLLGQREPKADTTLSLSRSYSADYDDVILRMKQAKDYFLLIGPPGTGKTSQALKFMVQENLSEQSMLLLSYTNRAVDEICEMLYGAGIDFLRIGNEFATDEQWQPYLLNSIARKTPQMSAIKNRILEAKVIVGTTSMISARTYLFGLKHFSLAIIDESSQILEPNIIGILSQQIEKFVLIGDYKQLPAVVQQSPEESRVEDNELNAIGLTDCRNSLFERLISIERKAGREQFVGLLRKQGRMHPDIAVFANENFYKEENLLPVPLPHQLEESGGRMLFYNIRKTDSNGNDKANVDEAVVAAKLVDELREQMGEDFNPRKSVGIIVPYRNQITTIRRELERYGVADYSRISIDTVERYQGSQRDVIIYSFTISKSSQLGFLTANTFYKNERPIDRKLNVAITRARKKFIALGDRSILSQNILFSKLMEYCECRD